MSIHKGQIGVKIIITGGSFLDEATDQEIRYQKPSGATGTFAASVVSQNLEYTTVSADDLDESGDWKLQGWAEGSGWEHKSDIEMINIDSNIEVT